MRFLGESSEALLALAGLHGALLLLCCWLWACCSRLKRESIAASKDAERINGQLDEAKRLAASAEEIAAIGLWQYSPDEGRHEWSPGLRNIFGLGQDEIFLPGDAETLLAANGVDLVSMVMARQDESKPFSLRFAIMRLDGSMRVLAVRARHIGALATRSRRVLGVVTDITEQSRREKGLAQSRDIALREARKARELANTDPLTGLANRRRVMAELDRLIVRSRQSGEPLAVIMLDIDYFKQVNDIHGHPVGDDVLRNIGQILRQQARAGDVAGRIGGEEFVWIAREADVSVARALAERLRQAVAERGAGIGAPPVTISVGLATMRNEDSGLGLFARADQALYQAKDQGRNTVRMAA
ncbi:GGDEF domain-containing protein [Altererythrobacter litoralis]|uniref:diguanylate cyclase n=1 Tax=Altererythrobacter litoralis TaxID=3113904 RepID=A0ABU7GE07_9SPHN|nr:GGDEF domain-containing protein [Erythrobacteraceae bacterium 1XM1-14]